MVLADAEGKWTKKAILTEREAPVHIQIAGSWTVHPETVTAARGPRNCMALRQTEAGCNRHSCLYERLHRRKTAPDYNSDNGEDEEG